MNEELNVRAALKSVAGWADDIIVLDSGSTDGTLAICQEFGVRTEFHKYLDHRSQLDWGLKRLPWRHDWLLLLDADNIVTDQLKMQIAEVLSNDAGISGYYSRHDHFFRNQQVRGLKRFWLRLIRRSKVTVDESELVDFRLIVSGPTASLSGAIVENNQKELAIDFWIDKHQKFAHRMALEEVLRNKGLLKWSHEIKPSLLGNPDERMIWFKNKWYELPLFVRPVLFFFYRYVLRLGLLDGWNGFVYHVFQALWFRLLVDVKIAELRQALSEGSVTLDELIASAGLRSSDTLKSMVP